MKPIGWAVLAISSWTAVAERAVADEESVTAKLRLLWPIHFTAVALSSSDRLSLEPSDFGHVLAKMGLDGFRRYVNETLPKELELDKRMALEFRDADHSRVNKAFRRWQKRVYADKTRIRVQQLSGNGEYAPRLKGINYNWDEFYAHPAFTRLHGRIDQLTRLYLKRTGGADIPKKFRIFSWVEVFDEGDAQRPMSFTDGAFVMGKYFVSLPRAEALKLNFEDPRGINPPYGKTFSYQAYQGSIVLFPTWVSHFITPNMHKETVVCISFIVYPPDGNSQDWEDDRTGSLEVSRSFQVERALPQRQEKRR